MWTKDTASSEVVVKEEAADTTELTSSHNIILEPQHRYTTSSTIILEPNIIPRQEKRVSRVIFEPLAPSAPLSPSSHDTDRSSPRILEALHPPGYTDLSYGVTVTLTPNTTGDYLDTSGSLQVGSTQLQYITPLPSFHSLPSSPNSKMNYSPPTAIVDGIEYSPDDKVEYIGQAVSLADYITYSSPDSSSQALPTSTSTPYNSSRGGHKRRRRRDTGSSTGSGTSTTSRQTKRRRTPISQEELMLQRNLGKDFFHFKFQKIIPSEIKIGGGDV